MNETASEYFGAMVDEYDSLIRRAVPRYDEMIARTVEYMPAGARRILEFGCGTGNLTLAVAERFPEAALALVDGAQEMLELTRGRLESERSVELIAGRFEDVELEAGAYDVVTSCIALHHVVDKRALFARIQDALRPGGLLVFADQMAGQTAGNHAINWNRMTEFWRLPDHCTAREARSLEEHAADHDHYVSVIDQVHLLEEVGFKDVDCVWRNWMWGVLWARSPATQPRTKTGRDPGGPRPVLLRRS